MLLSSIVTSPKRLISQSLSTGLPNRTVLTLVTVVTLSLCYGLYRVVFTPLIKPPTISGNKFQYKVNESLASPRQSQELADRYLVPEIPWAKNAKYQLRTTDAFIYAEDWEPVDSDYAVRFTPFAMVFIQKGKKKTERPITIICDSAYIRFPSKFQITKPSPGRVIGGSLEGDVTIKGPNGMVLTGRNFSFTEASMKLWCDSEVKFAYGPHRGKAIGLECELVPVPEPRDPKVFAVKGIRNVKLRRNVVMNLLFEQDRDSLFTRRRNTQKKKPNRKKTSNQKTTQKKKPVVVQVLSDGNFTYGVESHIAQFEKEVRVYRPTDSGKYDTLLCDILTLLFEPVETQNQNGTKTARNAKKKTAKDEKFQTIESTLTFRRLHAISSNPHKKVVLISEDNEMTAYLQDLVHDDETRITSLKDPQGVKILMRSSEMMCPKIQIVQNQQGEMESLFCQGKGWLEQFEENSKNIQFTAQWMGYLKHSKEKNSELEIIEFEKNAILRQPKDNSRLVADFIRLWVKNDENDKNKVQRVAFLPEGNRTDKKSAEKKKSNYKIERLLAMDNVHLMNSKMIADTKRLEVWFEEPHTSIRRTPTGSSFPKKFEAPPQFLPERRNGQAQFQVPQDDTSRIPKSHEPVTQPYPFVQKRKRSKKSTEPMQVSADLIRVRAVRQNHTKRKPNKPASASPTNQEYRIAEIWTMGNVKVRQKRSEGKTPLRMLGNRMHVLNRTEEDQVMHLYGKPAHIYDQKMHIEGSNIHLDRLRNKSWVDGSGLLQLPVERTLDGEKLKKTSVLDVRWQKKMTFDGLNAFFYDDVQSVLDDSRVLCEEMQVTLTEKLNFVEGQRQSGEKVDIARVYCKDQVDFESYIYKYSKLVEVRRGLCASLTINQTTGKTLAQGPGWITIWQRGRGRRAGLTSLSTTRPNQSLNTDKNKWEYTRIDFNGNSEGNSKTKTNTFKDGVQIVHGPVTRPPETIDPDMLPKNGGWMRCKSLQMVQHEKVGNRPAYVTMFGEGNAELEGRTFRARSDTVSYDESKELYILRSFGKRKATVWRQLVVGGKSSRQTGRRMEFIPSRNILKIDGATGFDGIQ